MKFEPHLYDSLNDKDFIGSLHVEISSPSSKPVTRFNYLTWAVLILGELMEHSNNPIL